MPDSSSARLAELRQARRAFVLTAHPDRGGDPAAFRVGLQRLDDQLAAAAGAAGAARTTSTAGGPAAGLRVTVVRPATGLLGRLRAARTRRAARRARRAGLR